MNAPRTYTLAELEALRDSTRAQRMASVRRRRLAEALFRHDPAAYAARTLRNRHGRIA